jgi:hypothetical protein
VDDQLAAGSHEARERLLLGAAELVGEDLVEDDRVIAGELRRFDFFWPISAKENRSKESSGAPSTEPAVGSTGVLSWPPPCTTRTCELLLMKAASADGARNAPSPSASVASTTVSAAAREAIAAREHAAMIVKRLIPLSLS